MIGALVFLGGLYGICAMYGRFKSAIMPVIYAIYLMGVPYLAFKLFQHLIGA